MFCLPTGGAVRFCLPTGGAVCVLFTDRRSGLCFVYRPAERSVFCLPTGGAVCVLFTDRRSGRATLDPATIDNPHQQQRHTNHCIGVKKGLVDPI